MIASAQGPAVAQAAGVPLEVWASVKSPRVMPGNKKGMTLGLHRGRLPFVEIWQASDQIDNTSSYDGWDTHQWNVRVSVGGFTQAIADRNAHELMAAVISAIRSNSRQKYGDSRIQGLTPGVLGFTLQAQVTIENRISLTTMASTGGKLLLASGGRILLASGGFLLLGQYADSKALNLPTARTIQSQYGRVTQDGQLRGPR